MKSRLLKKLIAYGFLPFMVVFFSVSPLFGINVVQAQGECNLVNPATFNLGMCLGTGATSLFVMFNTVLGLLLYVIGMVLDFAIQFSIAPMADPTTGVGGLYRSDSVNTAWTLLRDIINMSFIFILLYIAIGTVLNLSNVNWKKQVAQIIIAAILVNFSLFITRVVIDAGNIVANSFYTQLTECVPECPGASEDDPSRSQIGISERFMGALGIPQINSMAPISEMPSELRGWIGVPRALMQTVVILVTMWVFLSVAIMFIARTFALVFILILSPIGIAGSSLPILGSYAKQWRQQLFKQSMLGVVFLFFTFVILLIATDEREQVLNADIGVQGDGREYIDASLGPARNGEIPEELFIIYMLVIAGLIMSLRLTKNMSGQFGKFADSVGKGLVGTVAGVATGGTAWAMRAGFGGAASKTLANEKLKARARAGDGRAQFRLDAASRFAKSSFDVRDSALGKVASKQLKGAGFDVSRTQKMGKGGYEAGFEKFDKASLEKAKRYAPSDDYLKDEATRRGATDEKTLALEKEVIRQEEMKKFAASLQRDTWWKMVRKSPAVNLAKNMDRRRRRAADAIRKEINKKDFDKLLDVLKDSAKGGDKKEDNE